MELVEELEEDPVMVEDRGRGRNEQDDHVVERHERRAESAIPVGDCIQKH